MMFDNKKDREREREERGKCRLHISKNRSLQEWCNKPNQSKLIQNNPFWGWLKKIQKNTLNWPFFRMCPLRTVDQLVCHGSVFICFFGGRSSERGPATEELVSSRFLPVSWRKSIGISISFWTKLHSYNCFLIEKPGYLVFPTKILSFSQCF